MKRAFTPMRISAVAMLTAAIVYAFSFPLAVWFTLKYLPNDFILSVGKFYQPAVTIAVHCPPYLAILKWEARLLGVTISYHIPPPGHP